MLVFSTCWNSHRHQDGEEMIDEILSLGFDHVELSHGIKLSLLPGIMRAVEAGKVQVAGVHNYFPAPIDEVGDAPDSRPFTADLPQVRAKAIELTKKSMEQGAALGARIHCAAHGDGGTSGEAYGYGSFAEPGASGNGGNGVICRNQGRVCAPPQPACSRLSGTCP